MAWKTPPLESHLLPPTFLLVSSWINCGRQSCPSYSRRSQVKSRGCRAVGWLVWRLAQMSTTRVRAAICDWLLVLCVNVVSTEPHSWPPRASFSSPWRDSTDSTTSSPQTEPKTPQGPFASKPSEALQPYWWMDSPDFIDSNNHQISLYTRDFIYSWHFNNTGIRCLTTCSWKFSWILS